MAESDFRAEFDVAMFRGFMAAIKAFEPSLATATRRRLRQAGVETVEDMKRTIASGPGRGRVGVKAGISAGLSTAVATGKRQQGVRIRGTAAKIPAGHQPMLRLFNKRSFRHPVFGSDQWVEQSGRPYFGSVIKRHEDDMVEAVWAALEDAFNAMGAAQ